METISIFVGLALLIVFVLYVISIIDVIRNRNRFESYRTQGLWLMLIVFVPFFGSLIYLFIRDRTFVTR